MVQTIPDSQMYPNIETIIQSLRAVKSSFGNIDVDFVIKGLENSVKEGYQLVKSVDIPKLICVHCGKEIKYGMGETICGGTVDNLNPGYGSIFDGDLLIIAICDDCISILLKEKKLIRSHSEVE